MGATPPIRSFKTVAELGISEIYASARLTLPGGERTSANRAAAFESFAARGLPSSRNEAWKYTDLRRIMKDAKPLALQPGAAERARASGSGDLLSALDVRRLVVVDGAFIADLSDIENLEPGLAIRSMAMALAEDAPLLAHTTGSIVPSDEPALALNTALAADGVFIDRARRHRQTADSHRIRRDQCPTRGNLHALAACAWILRQRDARRDP